MEGDGLSWRRGGQTVVTSDKLLVSWDQLQQLPDADVFRKYLEKYDATQKTDSLKEAVYEISSRPPTPYFVIVY